ncbi:MAG TPA: isocitrate/isopropylmalate dehydrogenase family protein [Candidatus Methylomirabilis sp.]|nr:isocitrate/isopropylmalate dehydrogenase family protein [Candidatus Methylomirabilis sp.]
MATYRITVVPGDGIGPEVMAEALKVLRAVEAAFPGLTFDCKEYRAGAQCCQDTGTDLPDETLTACKAAHAILFGAAGLPAVRLPDGTEIRPQIKLRKLLDLYAGVRPIKRYAGVPPVLAGDPAIDYVILRENTEGLFASEGGGARVGELVAVDSLVITRVGTERIVRYAFRLAQQRSGAAADRVRRVTCVDKANVFQSMAFFRQIFYEVAREFAGIQTEHAYVDAMTMFLVQKPLHYDVAVTENMFGDIVSDLAAGTVGGLGLAPSADVGDTYGLFQPSHGTAPDIAGKGIANPIAQILSARMMLEWVGERQGDSQARQAARAIETAVEATLIDPRYHTADLGGRASTKLVGDAVVGKIRKS